MAVPYGTTTSLTLIVQRGANTLLALPGLLENKPHDISGVKWGVGLKTPTLPLGLKIDLVDAPKGKQVVITGATVAAGDSYSVVIVASSSYTVNGKPQPVTWIVTLKLEGDIPGSLPAPEAEPDNPPSETGSTLSWAAAHDLARAGRRIRLTSWSDRWLEFDGALWHLVIFAPLTKAVSARRIVQTTDCDVDWYTGQWTTAGIP